MNVEHQNKNQTFIPANLSCNFIFLYHWSPFFPNLHQEPFFLNFSTSITPILFNVHMEEALILWWRFASLYCTVTRVKLNSIFVASHLSHFFVKNFMRKFLSFLFLEMFFNVVWINNCFLCYFQTPMSFLKWGIVLAFDSLLFTSKISIFYTIITVPLFWLFSYFLF